MASLPPGASLPRGSGGATWKPLLNLWGKNVEQIMELPFDLKQARFHPAAEHCVTETELVEWRQTLNEWAINNGFPAKLGQGGKRRWDAALGQRLLKDGRDLPEILHPDVWAWMGTYLLPHFVVYRWGWPSAEQGEPPSGRQKWHRFASGPANGLRLALHQESTYGAEIVERATEEELQSVRNRPVFGNDQRVARVILETLVAANDDSSSIYGKSSRSTSKSKGKGSRADDANKVCTELRYINSLQPLCFATDGEIESIVHGVIERIPTLKGREL